MYRYRPLHLQEGMVKNMDLTNGRSRSVLPMKVLDVAPNNGMLYYVPQTTPATVMVLNGTEQKPARKMDMPIRTLAISKTGKAVQLQHSYNSDMVAMVKSTPTNNS
eukprot:sb/3477765/